MVTTGTLGMLMTVLFTASPIFMEGVIEPSAMPAATPQAFIMALDRPCADWGSSASACSALAARWATLAYLKAHGGDVQVQVAASSDGYLEGSVEAHETINMRFGDLLDQLHETADGAWRRRRPSKVHLHLAQCPLPLLPELLCDARPPPRCVADAAPRGECAVQTNLWFCVGAGCSALHYDCYDNLMMVVRGVKHVMLLPPSATRLLRPRAAHCLSANRSSLPREALEELLAGLEACGLATRMSIVAGRTLFIPQGWWHQVDSPEDVTIAVNHWFSAADDDDRERRHHSPQYLLRRAFEEATEEERHRLLHQSAGDVPLEVPPSSVGRVLPSSLGLLPPSSALASSQECGPDGEGPPGGAAACACTRARGVADVQGGHAGNRLEALADLVFEAMGSMGSSHEGGGKGVPSSCSEIDEPRLLRLLLCTPAHELLAALAASARTTPQAAHPAQEAQPSRAAKLRVLLTRRLGPAGAHALGERLQEAVGAECVSCAARAAAHVEELLSVVGGEAERAAERQRLLGLARQFTDSAACNVLRHTLGLEVGALGEGHAVAERVDMSAQEGAAPGPAPADACPPRRAERRGEALGDEAGSPRGSPRKRPHAC